MNDSGLQTRKVDKCDRIAVALQQAPGLSQAEICRITKLNPSYVSRALRNGGMDDIHEPVIDSPDRRWFLLEDDIPTVSKFLVKGLDCQQLEVLPVELPAPGYCAVTGEPIASGYRAMDIVPAAAGEFLDLLGGNVMGWLSEATAIAFKNTWNLGSRLIFEDGTHYHPLIDRVTAEKKDRACWSDLARQIWPERANQRALIIVTLDSKKRIWPRARIGTLGSRSAVYLYDLRDSQGKPVQGQTSAPKSCGVSISASLWIDWQRFLELLDVIEGIYDSGFSKCGIIKNILPETKAISAVGLQTALRWENELHGLRDSAEFKLAVTIAQRGER